MGSSPQAEAETVGEYAVFRQRGPQRTKRHHHKSRLGCRVCKRRKVKCDESQPSCAKCMSFGLPCEYDNGVPANDPLAVIRSTVAASVPAPDPLPRRGPGRPRKDWAARLGISCRTVSSPPPPCHPTRSLSPAFPSVFRDAALDISQAELLHHFSVYTGPSLVATEYRDHPVARFWQSNAPQLGFSQPYVLHMALSLAAHHLKRLRTPQDGVQEWHYGGLAARHLSMGIAEMNKELSVMDRGNCGALLASSILICYGTFAAGPTGPEDLLLCDLGISATSGRVLPIIRGIRFIEDSFDAGDLYAGLLRPLDPIVAGALDDPRPSYLCLGFPRVDWMAPLARLREVVERDSSPDAPVYTRAFEIVASVYEALYGNDKGGMECPTYYKVVLIFLYFAEDRFIACLKNGETMAMLILAYYAPLLKANPNEWLLRGWAEHIVDSIRDRIEGDHAHLMDWPVEITR